MGALFGLGMLVIAFQALAGYTALDPTSYLEFVLVVAVAALGGGIAAHALRRDLHRAVRRGLVCELRGVPARSTLPGAIDIGGVSFCGGTSWLSHVRAESLNVLSYVELGAPATGKLRVLMLGVNQQQFARAQRGVVALSASSGGPVPPAAAGVAGG
jgi:hypothetical protein